MLKDTFLSVARKGLAHHAIHWFINTGNSRCLTRRWLTLSDCSRSTLGSQKISLNTTYFQCQGHGHGSQNSSKVAGWGLCQLQFTPSTYLGGIILRFLCDQTSNILEFHSFLNGVSLIEYAVCHCLFTWTNAVLHSSFARFAKLSHSAKTTS